MAPVFIFQLLKEATRNLDRDGIPAIARPSSLSTVLLSLTAGRKAFAPAKFGPLDTLPIGGSSTIRPPAQLDPAFRQLFITVLNALCRGDREKGNEAIKASLKAIQESGCFTHATFITLRCFLDLEEQIRVRPFRLPKWEPESIPVWLSNFFLAARWRYDGLSEMDLVARSFRCVGGKLNARSVEEFRFLQFLVQAMEQCALPSDESAEFSDMQVLFHVLCHSYMVNYEFDNSLRSPEEKEYIRSVKAWEIGQFARLAEFLVNQSRVDILVFAYRLRNMNSHGQTNKSSLGGKKQWLPFLLSASTCSTTKYQRAMCRWQALQLQSRNVPKDLNERTEIATAFAQCGAPLLEARVHLFHWRYPNPTQLTELPVEKLEEMRSKISPRMYPWLYARLAAAEIQKQLVVSDGEDLSVRVERIVDVEQAERLRLGNKHGRNGSQSELYYWLVMWNRANIGFEQWTTVVKNRVVLARYAESLMIRAPPPRDLRLELAEAIYKAYHNYCEDDAAFGGEAVLEICKCAAAWARRWLDETKRALLPRDEALEAFSYYTILLARHTSSESVRRDLLESVEKEVNDQFNRLVNIQPKSTPADLALAIRVARWMTMANFYHAERPAKVEDVQLFGEVLRIRASTKFSRKDRKQLNDIIAAQRDLYRGLPADRGAYNPPTYDPIQIASSEVGQRLEDGTEITEDIYKHAVRCKEGIDWLMQTEKQVREATKRLKSEYW